MPKESQSPKFLPCKIIRESKIINFNDTNEIEEETTFLVEVDEKRIEDNQEYIMELPITYFRIPEKSIKEYEDFQEVKSSIEIFKKLKKKQEYLDNIDDFGENYAKILQKLDGTAEYKLFKEYFDLKEKEKKEVAELVQKVKNLPKVKPFIDKEKLEIKNLSILLNDTNADDLIERIIWCFIFEEVLHLKSSNLENLSQFIENEIKNGKKETKEKKIKFNKSIKREIESINIREFLEISGKFETSINYPNKKRKKIFHHNSDFRFFYFGVIQLSLLILIIGLSIFKESYTVFFNFWLISIILFLVIFKLFTKLIQRNRLMKGDNLLDKFNRIIEKYLYKKEDHPEWDEKMYIKENLKISLFLDSLSEKLFKNIYKAIYNDLDKCIFDYKSFNPMSLDILFEDNKVLFPLKTPLTGFFHKTNIAINSNDLPKDNFSVKIKTKNIVRKNRKNAKIMNLKIIRPKNLKRPLLIQGFVLALTILYIVFYELGIIPDFFDFWFILMAIIYILSAFAYVLFYIKQKYFYHTKLTNLKNIDGKFESNRFLLIRNRNKVIYSLPIILREDCSYYYTIYAPNYHNLKFTEEIRVILNEINIRLPLELSTNTLSFNIPRRKSFENELEFDIDLEIPIANTVKWWIFGIFSMIFLLLSIGIIFLGSIINPLFLEGEFDISSLRFVLTFLTLLIGFFGKDIISNPTKDLYKVSILIIIFSIIVGILFLIPIFI